VRSARLGRSFNFYGVFISRCCHDDFRSVVIGCVSEPGTALASPERGNRMPPDFEIRPIATV